MIVWIAENSKAIGADTGFEYGCDIMGVFTSRETAERFVEENTKKETEDPYSYTRFDKSDQTSWHNGLNHSYFVTKHDVVQ